MNWRERLADWISGGAFSAAMSVARFSTSEMLRKHNIAAVRRNALLKIAAQETPSANATVKRMARIAREALE